MPKIHVGEGEWSFEQIEKIFFCEKENLEIRFEAKGIKKLIKGLANLYCIMIILNIPKIKSTLKSK